MTWQNVLEMITVLIVFVLVLVATYYTTKWIGKSGVVPTHTKNIKVIESFRIAPNKYIQIVQLGNKYYSIGVSKDNITFLTSLEEEQLDFTEEKMNGQSAEAFRDIMDRIRSGYHKIKKEK